MYEEDPHPLILWLKERKKHVTSFARENGATYFQIYWALNPKKRRVRAMPPVEVMQIIETGSEGAVTIRDQIAWYNRVAMPEKEPKP